MNTIQKRIYAIDFTRGLVMIIMALDHTRDFMHVTSLTQSPTDLSTTSPALFFTRWITHLCAPTFVFLSGASAFLSLSKAGNFTKSRNFLLSRGAWLILLEFTLVNFALWFDLRFRMLIFEVIATIGFGFIILALLVKLPARVIGIAGLVIIFAHNLSQYIPPGKGSLQTVVSAFLNLNVYTVSPGFTFLMAYPPIPWLGIMLAGYGAGKLFEHEQVQRKRLFLRIGLAALALFAIIRLLNGYGDLSKWAVQKTPVFSFLSFMNVSKYPPSLLFCLVTLGIMFLILSLAEGVTNTFSRMVMVYGRVPLFYFLVHLYILHALMLVLVFVQGFTWSELVFGAFSFGRPKELSGVPLWIIYLLWLGVVISLYPFCRWYGAYKANHPEKTWLRYL